MSPRRPGGRVDWTGRWSGAAGYPQSGAVDPPHCRALDRRYLMARSRRSFILLVVATFVASQILAQPPSADDRVTNLELEVALLKRLLAEQDRRITALEKKLAVGTSDVSAVSSPAPGDRLTPPSAARGWQVARNWAKIRNGMSERQVTDILGAPTSTEDLGPFRTLFYRGEVTGSGFVSGNVELNKDRVWQINTPVF